MKFVWVVNDKEFNQVYLFSKKSKAKLFIENELSNGESNNYCLYKQKVL